MSRFRVAISRTLRTVCLSLFSLSIPLAATADDTASRAGFDAQTLISAAFDSMSGEQGELRWHSPSSLYWRNTATHPQITSGFAYRQLSGDFLLHLQLHPHPLDPRPFTFGLQINGAAGFSLRVLLPPLQYPQMLVQNRRLPPLVQVRNPQLLQLERKGDTLVFSAAPAGKPLVVVARYSIEASQLLVSDALQVGVYREFSATAGDLEIKDLYWQTPKSSH